MDFIEVGSFEMLKTSLTNYLEKPDEEAQKVAVETELTKLIDTAD
jgi:hypothetical protein